MTYADLENEEETPSDFLLRRLIRLVLLSSQSTKNGLLYDPFGKDLEFPSLFLIKKDAALLFVSFRNGSSSAENSRRPKTLAVELSLSLFSLSSAPSLSLLAVAPSLSSPVPCGGGGDRISTFSYPCFISRSRLRWSVLNPSCSHVLLSMSLGNHIESRGSTWGSSSTLGIHRSCRGIHKNIEAPIGAVVESTRIRGRSLVGATHGEKRKTSQPRVAGYKNVHCRVLSSWSGIGVLKVS
ncbi:hypothetical protein YC2023_023328 [Brassica napus]